MLKGKNMTIIQSEVDSLAEELSRTQDQLLAISKLGNINPQQYNFQELLDHFCDQGLQILAAKSFFLYLSTSKYGKIFSENPKEYFDKEEIVGLLINDKNLATTWQHIHSVNLQSTYAIQRKVNEEETLFLGFQLDIPISSLAPTFKLADAIADQATVQISNVSSHKMLLSQAETESELRAARQVQSSLLPLKIPTVENSGIQIGLHSKPAAAVGGDFFDVQCSSNNHIFFALGDISGKRLPAAILMSMTLNSIRNAVRFLPNPTPKIIINRVNQNMYEDFTRVGAFASVFLGYFNLNSSTLVYSNAGHSPVIFCPSGREAFLLKADGPGLGVLRKNICRTKELQFQEDDLLVISSDGFNEAENTKGEMFGIDAMVELSEQLRNKSASEIKDGFLDAVNNFSRNHPQFDDQTMLVIKRVAE